jgi:hypothetical protein
MSSPAEKKPRTAEQRAKHAAEVAKSRADKKARGECRQCKDPAARALDGRVMSACDKHLDADQKRRHIKRPPNGSRSKRKAIR